MQRSGFNRNDLLTAYTTLIRPVFDFAAVTYHSLLTRDQTNALERLQKRAIKLIDDNYTGYETSLSNLGLTTLEDRRLALIDGFLRKAVNNPRFTQNWFPLKGAHGYDTRHEKNYMEYKYNTERAKRGPLSFFRRRLNEAGI